MKIEVEKLEEIDLQWLTDRASSRGTYPEMEALGLLKEAIRERRRREGLFARADEMRIRIPGPPLTTEEIEQAINWGRP